VLRPGDAKRNAAAAAMAGAAVPQARRPVPGPPQRAIAVNAKLSPKRYLLKIFARNRGSRAGRDMTSCTHRTGDHDKAAPTIFAAFDRAKLTAMAVAGVLFMVLVACTVLFIAHSELAAERVEKAHAMVDAVWNMADSLQHEARSGAMSEDEARKRFFAAASGIWFEGHTNYVFIYDTETGLCVMNVGNASLLGKDVRGLRTPMACRSHR